MKLPGKTAIITGASRGIGRALALRLARSGCKLMLTAVEKDELAALTERLTGDLGASAVSLPADLTDEMQRRLFLEWIGAAKEPPDILINNAGGGRFGRFDAADWRDIDRTLDLNIRISTHLTRALIPVLRARPEAKIVNISSAISRLPYPGLAVYGAAKGYVSSLSESLASELAGTTISVLCFHPGFTETQFMSSAGMDMGKIPGFLIHSPDVVAGRIVRAISKDKTWAYGDIGGRAGLLLAGCLPHKVRIRVFKNLFWRLPDEE